MLKLCLAHNRQDYRSLIILGRLLGLRIHEAMRIDTATARAALKTGEITVKGKGGRVRSVPINEDARIVLEDALKGTKSGQKLFVPEGKETHVAIHDLQKFICKHRDEIRVPDSDKKPPMTFHGVRHSYVVEHYTRLRLEGDTHLLACKKLAPLLGHSRPDIVCLYLPRAVQSQFGDGGDDDV